MDYVSIPHSVVSENAEGDLFRTVNGIGRAFVYRRITASEKTVASTQKISPTVIMQVSVNP